MLVFVWTIAAIGIAFTIFSGDHCVQRGNLRSLAMLEGSASGVPECAKQQRALTCPGRAALTCKGRPERQAQEKQANLVANIAYLSLGWCAVGIWTPVTSFAEPETVRLFVCGGVLYSVGFVFFASPWLKFNTAIWHVFVLAAAASHLQGVLRGIARSQVGGVAWTLGTST